MTEALPTQAQVVIVGGGIIGCSMAYHLTKLGLRDVVLLERGHLTGGTSWHAAGLVNQLRATSTLTELARYAVGLYETLEAETGQATGFRRKGSLPIARTEERLTEIRRTAALGDCFGVEAYEVGLNEVKALYPLMDVSRIKGAIYIPGDGQTNPVDTAMALAKGARGRGARIFEETAVTGFERRTARSPASAPAQGTIACETVVNCGGVWAREIGLDGGRQRAALRRRAHVRGHRADRGALARCADRPRHRRLHLREGGRRPPSRRLLRARCQAAAAGEAARWAPSSSSCRRTGTTSSCR